VDTVAVESTGLYWVPLFQVLDQFGIDGDLVHASYCSRVPGKKSDVLDCQWLRELHRHGLLPRAFRPSQDLCSFRTLGRHRARLIEELTRQVNMVRIGGIYRADFMNPYTEFVDHTDWDGEGYRITMPYAQRMRHRPDGAMEFRSYLDEVFNGLLDTGFTIERVFAAPHDSSPPPDAEPGSFRHWSWFIGGGYTIIARKE